MKNAMDNRRQDYRHVFEPHQHRTAALTSHAAKSVRGEIVDLSVGGMRLRMTERTVPLRPRERIRVQFSLDGDQPLSVDAEVVYATADAEAHCGMHFLRLADAQANDARERKLWGFLLEEQLRARRRQLPAPPLAG